MGLELSRAAQTPTWPQLCQSAPSASPRRPSSRRMGVQGCVAALVQGAIAVVRCRFDSLFTSGGAGTGDAPDVRHTPHLDALGANPLDLRHRAEWRPAEHRIQELLDVTNRRWCPTRQVRLTCAAVHRKPRCA